MHIIKLFLGHIFRIANSWFFLSPFHSRHLIFVPFACFGHFSHSMRSIKSPKRIRRGTTWIEIGEKTHSDFVSIFSLYVFDIFNAPAKENENENFQMRKNAKWILRFVFSSFLSLLAIRKSVERVDVFSLVKYPAARTHLADCRFFRFE